MKVREVNEGARERWSEVNEGQVKGRGSGAEETCVYVRGSGG